MPTVMQTWCTTKQKMDQIVHRKSIVVYLSPPTAYQQAPGSIAKHWRKYSNTIAQRWRWAFPMAWANPFISNRCRRCFRTRQFCRRKACRTCWLSSFSHIKHRSPLARWRLRIKPNISPPETTSIWTPMLIYYQSRKNIKMQKRVSKKLVMYEVQCLVNESFVNVISLTLHDQSNWL